MFVFVNKDENNKVNCVILIYYEIFLIYDFFNLIMIEYLEKLVKEYNIKIINISDKIFSYYAVYFEKNSKVYEVNY